MKNNWLNELYYDNTIIYNGSVEDEYDEVIIYVSNQETLDIMYENYEKWKVNKVRFHINKQIFDCNIDNDTS